MNRDEEQFIERVRTSLDQVEADIPPHVAARLRHARHSAIVSRHRYTIPIWMPAMSAAMLVLVVAVAWFSGLPQMDDPMPLSAQQTTADFEMLVHGEDLELFADLDFYLWLEKQNGHTS